MTEPLHTSDIRIDSFIPLAAPQVLKTKLPITDESRRTVLESRASISRILSREDRRLMAVVGPCSIHDPESALDYAHRLKELSHRVSDVFLVVMRVYFEKPRTRLGWRGLILDPHLDGSYDIETGLERARSLLLDITALGLPTGSEMLDPIVPQYIDDLVSWASIGARTTESQTHREMASGLSTAVGFKNSTDGSEENAINAMASSLKSHSFIGIDHDGKTCVIHTRGNGEVFIILRGGRQGPNYHPWDTLRVEEMLRRAELPQNIVIDCSHGNSERDPLKQPEVLQDVILQYREGRDSIRGFMVESNIVSGRQDISVEPLVYGMSVTDACLGWEETEGLLLDVAGRIREAERSGT